MEVIKSVLDNKWSNRLSNLLGILWLIFILFPKESLAHGILADVMLYTLLVCVAADICIAVRSGRKAGTAEPGREAPTGYGKYSRRSQLLFTVIWTVNILVLVIRKGPLLLTIPAVLVWAYLIAVYILMLKKSREKCLREDHSENDAS